MKPETEKKLDAKDVLPHINRTQATDRAEKCRFLSLVALSFDKAPLNLRTLWRYIN